MMASAKVFFTLSCVALLATTWGYNMVYNMKQIGVCLQIVSEATSAAATQVLPLFDDLTKCTKFRNYMDLDNLSILMLGMVVYSWLQSLALEIHCLWEIDDRFTAILKPHLQRLDQYQCMYLGLPPACLPQI